MDEVADLRGSLARLQGQLKRDIDRVDESADLRAKLLEDVDERLTKLEQAQQHFGGKVELSLESLWQRTTELGVALAEMPPAMSLQAAVQSVEVLQTALQAQVSSMEAATVLAREEAEASAASFDAALVQSRRDAEASVAALDAAVRQLRRDVEASTEWQRSAQQEALQKSRGELDALLASQHAAQLEAARGLRLEVEEAARTAREGLRDLGAQVFGASRDSLRAVFEEAQGELRLGLRELTSRIFGDEAVEEARASPPQEPVATTAAAADPAFCIAAPPSAAPPVGGWRRPRPATFGGTGPCGSAAAVPDAPPLAVRVAAAEGRLQELERLGEVPLAIGRRCDERLAEVAGRLEETSSELGAVRAALQAKADRGHTHDHLVSADGSVTFAL